MALGFFNLGPGTRMFGQIGVPSIFWGSQDLGDPLREKEYVLNYEKKRVTNLELILTHMHRTGRQRLFLEPLHSFLDKNSVNERAPFPRVYASLVSSLRSNEQWRLLLYICIQWLAEYIPLKKTAEGGRKFSFNLFRCFKPHFLELQLWSQIAPTVLQTTEYTDKSKQVVWVI